MVRSQPHLTWSCTWLLCSMGGNAAGMLQILPASRALRKAKRPQAGERHQGSGLSQESCTSGHVEIQKHRCCWPHSSSQCYFLWIKLLTPSTSFPSKALYEFQWFTKGCWVLFYMLFKFLSFIRLLRFLPHIICAVKWHTAFLCIS